MEDRSAHSRRQTRHSWLRTYLGCALLGSTLLAGCGGTIPEDENVNLGIPYREQDQFNYCVPAAIQMWRLYDDLPNVSQATIFNWLGGAPCEPDEVPDGVDHFTNTNDAYLDLQNATVTQRKQMIARQVTSYNNSRPVIAVVYPSRDHVGVINKGKYVDEGDYWTWDWIRLHNPDPFYGANQYHGAQTWIETFCDIGFAYCAQIASSSATAGWSSNQSTYEPYLAIYGGGGPPICDDNIIGEETNIDCDPHD